MLNYHKMKYWEPSEDGIFHVAMCVYKAPTTSSSNVTLCVACSNERS